MPNKLMSLVEARKLMAASFERPVSVATLRRWITAGIKANRKKKRIRLAAVRTGGRWMVTIDAIEAFVKTCSGKPELPLSLTREGGRIAKTVQQFLEEEGFVPSTKNQVPGGLRTDSDDPRTVPDVLSEREVRDQERESHGTRISRERLDEVAAQCAKVGVPIAVRGFLTETD